MRPFYFALWLLLNQNCKLQSFLSFKLNFFSGYFCPSHVLTFSKTFFDKPKTLIFSPYKKCFSFLKFALWSFNLKVHNTWVSLYVAFGSANFVVLFGKNISDKNIYFVRSKKVFFAARVIFFFRRQVGRSVGVITVMKCFFSIWFNK